MLKGGIITLVIAVLLTGCGSYIVRQYDVNNYDYEIVEIDRVGLADSMAVATQIEIKRVGEDTAIAVFPLNTYKFRIDSIGYTEPGFEGEVRLRIFKRDAADSTSYFLIAPQHRGKTLVKEND